MPDGIRFFTITILCALTAVFFGDTHALYAQASQHPSDDYIFHASYGHSFTSVRLLGKTPGTVTNMVNIGGAKHIYDFKSGASLYYKAAILPYIQYYYPRRDYNNDKKNITGFGLVPVGFLYHKTLNPPLSFIVDTSGGLVVVPHNFPTDKGRKLNFTFEVSPSLVVNFNKKTALAIGYKYHHISNANTGRQNPGIDSNFLFLSVLVF